MNELLTAAQTAALLQLHPRTVYKLARRGQLPGRKFGGGWRFSKDEILKMVAGGERRFPIELDTLDRGGDSK